MLKPYPGGNPVAMPVSLSKPIVGVDVAKNELVIYQSDGDFLEEIPNTRTHPSSSG
ncbi:hypothetical protein AB7M30_004594 [Pseudomonas sp. F-14 TE3931]